MRESKIERALVEGVAKLGGSCEKFVSPGRRGVPDRIIFWPPSGADPFPIVEFVELKAPGGRLSSGQKRDHERRKTMGLDVYVIWNMEQVEEYLRGWGKV